MKNKFSITITTFLALLAVSHAGAKSKEIDYGGSILVDADRFDGVYNAAADSTGNTSDDISEVRRAQLYLKYKFSEDWSSKLQLGYEEKSGKTEVKDAYIVYKGWDIADITIGQDKEPFSLDLMTSLKNSSAIEKNVAGKAFRIGRNIGVNLSSDSNDYSWSIGVYQVGEYGSKPALGGGGKLALTGRGTLSPVNDNGKVLHLGASFSRRDLDGAVFEVESNAEIHGAPDILDTRKFQADSIDQYGLESAWISNRFALTGEAYRQDVTGLQESDSVSYSGYYLQGSYFLTNDLLRYKKGRLSSVRPKADSGAWQLVLRHSYLDAEDNEDGMEVTNTLVGINYYFSRSTKLMLNLTRTELSGHDVQDLDSGDAISLRAQYRF